VREQLVTPASPKRCAGPSHGTRFPLATLTGSIYEAAMRIFTLVAAVTLLAGCDTQSVPSPNPYPNVPTPRAESQPPPISGQTWQPGEWDWSGTDFVWNQGTYVDHRSGWIWEPGHWAQDGSGWVWMNGAWVRRNWGLLGNL
jgi:hypothetical protein